MVGHPLATADWGLRIFSLSIADWRLAGRVARNHPVNHQSAIDNNKIRNRQSPIVN
jgi:hypothetical protein